MCSDRCLTSLAVLRTRRRGGAPGEVEGSPSLKAKPGKDIMTHCSSQLVHTVLTAEALEPKAELVVKWSLARRASWDGRSYRQLLG